MCLTGWPFLDRVPWWLRHWRRLLLATGLVVALLVLSLLASRQASICAALGTEAPCVWREVAHLRGVATFIAYDPPDPADPATPLTALVTIKRRTLVLRLSPSSEAALVETVEDDATDYRHLLVSSAAWASLRELARVSEGVAIVEDAAPLTAWPPITVEPALGESRQLRVRIALIVLA